MAPDAYKVSVRDAENKQNQRKQNLFSSCKPRHTIFIGQDASASLNISVGLTVGVKEPLFFNHYGRQKKEGGSAASSCPSCTTRLCQFVRMSYSINRSYQLKGIKTCIAELILTTYRRKKNTRFDHCLQKGYQKSFRHDTATVSTKSCENLIPC